MIQTQVQESSSGFRMLISTDSHLGFKEGHHIRENDSFDALEEILQMSKSSKVDFLLFGGDFFHDITPSQNCMYRTMTILQKHIFGSGVLTFSTKRIAIPFSANYLNENLNIELPIFMIHGNHDYPSTNGSNISSLDVLQASHLINYIGKTSDLDQITVEPILFEKKSVKIALYALGHVKDTRLHYLLEKKKVHFVDPPSPDYMNILIIHQNRFKGIKVGIPYKSCIHPSMLPNNMDLVIWGNEHESLDQLIEDPVHNFYIYQPGSSIATSLNHAEALGKHVGIIEIYPNKNFKFEAIPLKVQRPLYVENIELEDLVCKKNRDQSAVEMIAENEEKQIESRLEEIVNRFIEESKHLQSNSPCLKSPPLVRLKVEYSGFDIIRIKNLESKFLGKVANEGEIFKFWKKQSPKKTAHGFNEKLNKRFEECLKEKISFETLASDASLLVKSIFDDMMQSSQKKPKVLLNPSIFMNNPQRMGAQNINSQIVNTLNFTNTKVLKEKLTGTRILSNSIVQLSSQCCKTSFRDCGDYAQQFGNLLKDYDFQLSSIPNFMSDRLKLLSSSIIEESEIKDQKIVYENNYFENNLIMTPPVDCRFSLLNQENMEQAYNFNSIHYETLENFGKLEESRQSTYSNCEVKISPPLKEINHNTPVLLNGSQLRRKRENEMTNKDDSKFDLKKVKKTQILDLKSILSISTKSNNSENHLEL